MIYSNFDGKKEFKKNVYRNVKEALYEDLLDVGDITANALVDESIKAVSYIEAREKGIVSGIDFVIESFLQIDPDLKIKILKNNGDSVNNKEHIIKVEGSLKNILIAERTALNFLGHFSGISTETNKIVNIVKDYPVQIACTRKTMPLFRFAEKIAVIDGGGNSHRWGLHDAVMIKDNYAELFGGVYSCLKKIKEKVDKKITIEVEIDNINDLAKILKEKPDIILLDNMTPLEIKKAVKICNRRSKLEASGNINIKNVLEYAKTGVDIISMGSITHSFKNFDVSLEVEKVIK